MPGKYGPHGELLFFLIQKDLTSMLGIETFSSFFTADIGTPFFSADVLKKCALMGMHQTAEEGKEVERVVVKTPDLGDTWRYGCPKSPMSKSEDEDWQENASVSSGVSRENNVCNGALHVIGLYGLGDKISLSLFLEDWQLARVALSCHIALDMLCQEMHETR